MTNLEFHPAAQSEYDSAADWYTNKSAKAAARFVSEVETAIDAIRRNPEQYSRWDNVHRFYLLNSFPYYVAYRLTSDSVVVVAIRHASQDQEAWKGR